MRDPDHESTRGRDGRASSAIVLTALLTVAAACAGEPPDEPIEASDPVAEIEDAANGSSAQEPAVDTLVDARLEPVEAAPEDDASAVDGRVLVLWEGGNRPLELIVAAEGLSVGDHSWDIHAGSCTSEGPVALALSETGTEPAVVGPLLVDQTRTVDETFEVPELSGLVPSQGRYTLHIHADPGIVHADEALQPPATVACARL